MKQQMLTMLNALCTIDDDDGDNDGDDDDDAEDADGDDDDGDEEDDDDIDDKEFLFLMESIVLICFEFSVTKNIKDYEK